MALLDRSRLAERLRSACDFVVWHCGDYRHDHEFVKLIKSRFGSGVRYDTVTSPGGVFGLVHEQRRSHEEGIRLFDFATYVDLHRVETAVLVSHDTCGRYAQHHDFLCQEDERMIHRRDLRRAQERLRVRFPLLRIHLFIAEMRDERTTALREVIAEGAHPHVNGMQSCGPADVE